MSSAPVGLHTPLKQRLAAAISRPSDSAWCRGLLAPLLRWWLRAATEDQRTWMYPCDAPRVTVRGADEIRILILGDAPAMGFGVRTHQLGLAGQLARTISTLTGRGVTVKAQGMPSMPLSAIPAQCRGVDIARYHAVVIVAPVTDALALTSPSGWVTSLAAAIGPLRHAAQAAFLTTVADLAAIERLAPTRRYHAGRHARRLNREARRVCAESRFPLIPLESATELNSATYATWATQIAARITDTLVHQTLGATA